MTDPSDGRSGAVHFYVGSRSGRGEHILCTRNEFSRRQIPHCRQQQLPSIQSLLRRGFNSRDLDSEAAVSVLVGGTTVPWAVIG